jgi:hypothetical protein
MDKLSEHNKKRYEKLSQLAVESKQQQMAGILCDMCNSEMYYLNPNTVLASNPPKMTVQCSNLACNNLDYKVK